MNHPYTHRNLVDMAVKWLGRTCPVVIAEMATTGETPDAIGWHNCTTLVECKISRSDLFADRAKPWRIWPCLGLGRKRYLLVPAGLASVADLPTPKWGLLEAHGSRIKVVKEAELQDEWNHQGEAGLLLSALRRSVTASTVGVSVKCYTIDSKGTAQLHVEREGLVDTGVEIGYGGGVQETKN